MAKMQKKKIRKIFFADLFIGTPVGGIPLLVGPNSRSNACANPEPSLQFVTK